MSSYLESNGFIVILNAVNNYGLLLREERGAGICQVSQGFQTSHFGNDQLLGIKQCTG